MNTCEEALRLTKRNLETLIAAKHSDEVLMTPWLEIVNAALESQVIPRRGRYDGNAWIAEKIASAGNTGAEQ
jgi:hypothetical protein